MILTATSAACAPPQDMPAPDADDENAQVTPAALTTGPETEIAAFTGGDVWLATVVETTAGFGLFWLRSEPAAPNQARLYYAHVEPSGAVTHAAKHVLTVSKIPSRNRYYNVAWHTDHFGVLTAEGTTLMYRTLSIDGTPGTKKTVGPPLLADPQWDSEADSDIAVYPSGFAVAVEGECAGHSCSYIFRLAPDGSPLDLPKNIVDGDFTHEFFPRIDYDGNGFAVMTVKDVSLSKGGVGTKYWTPGGPLSTKKKVVEAKQYRWDERPALAYNGSNFAAIWTENPARDHDTPWQVQFASFARSSSASTTIAGAVLSAEPAKPWFRWCSQVHPWGDGWLVQYLHGVEGQDPEAVFQSVQNDATVVSTLVPFHAEADLLASSPHTSAPGALGVLRADRAGDDVRIVFQTLSQGAPPPADTVEVAGRITYHATGAPLAGVSVVLSDEDGFVAQTATDLDGHYTFDDLPAGATYRVEPASNAPRGASVSSLDATRILQFVAGTTQLSQLARLAGDTTGNGSMSALDASRVLQLVAGAIPSLPAADLCATEWLFSGAPAPQAIAPGVEGGVCETGALEYASLEVTVTNADFQAVLIGDVTGNYVQ